MIPIAYNLRNLAVRKATTAAAAGGLALVVFVFASALMLSNGIERTLGRGASPGVAIVLRKGSDAELSSTLDRNAASLVLSAKEVASSAQGAPSGVAELVVVILRHKLGTDGFSNVQVRGVQEGSREFRPTMRIIDGRAPQPGTDEVMVGRAIRGRFEGLDLGQTFELKKNRPATVVGVFEDGGSSFESEVWVDLDVLRTSFGRPGLFSSVRVRLASPSQLDAFKANVESNRQLQLQAMSEAAFGDKQSQGLSLFVKALGFLIAVFFSVGAMIGAMITMHAAIASRQREIGTLRALGFSRGTILASFLVESTVLAVIGGAIGAVASLGMSFVRFSTMNPSTWSELVFSFDPTPGIVGAAMVASAVMGVLGGFFPAIRAARLSPVVAMRG